MRRGKKKAVATPPVDDGRPPRPEDLNEARDSLRAQLNGANVATGFGLQHGWCLFVFTDDAGLNVPATHAGFNVVRRGVPVIPPLGGRR